MTWTMWLFPEKEKPPPCDTEAAASCWRSRGLGRIQEATSSVTMRRYG